MLARDEVGPDQLVDAIKVCADEIGGQRLPHRKSWRTLVRVVAKDVEGGEDVLDAIIPGWRIDEAVRFPAELLGPYQGVLPEGRREGLEIRFFASVNIGAEDARDLYFEGFQPAVEPRNDNSLS